MSLTAPYSNAMRIGQGFNSYTQEIRIEDAVRIKKNGANDLFRSINAPATEQPAATTKPFEPVLNDSEASAPAPLKVDVDTAAKATSVDGPAATSNTFFALPNSPLFKGSQSVTYSTRAIQNVSEIMDVLNISTAMSIKYGTIHGNASASYVNESKVLDSQLNYVIIVKVNNDTHVCPEEMQFQPIDDLDPDQFTEVYGDCFISGFLEGGEFNAIVSVNVHDKSKIRQVKQAIDLQLAVGPSPVSIGAQESVSKDHTELLRDTEISISVNWSGGGDIKKPEVPWTLPTVVAVANAFPSMVARRSSKTSAILTKYTSLRSFQTWMWKKHDEEKNSERKTVEEKNGEKKSEVSRWTAKHLILNYAPCNIYTADLFDALMAYKQLWKQIDRIMQDPTKWKMRERSKTIEPTPATRQSLDKPSTTCYTTIVQKDWSPSSAQPVVNGTSIATNELVRSVSPRRQFTFSVDDDMVQEDWDIDANNNSREPISLDPLALNEARLLCREAITLITEEAARLVNHPDLAYADFNGKTRKTRMKKPNYAYPEVLRNRLPVPFQNDAADDSHSRDAAAVMTKTFSRGGDLFCHIVGDIPNPHRTYKAFTSLVLNEAHGASTEHSLEALSIHGYHHHTIAPGHFSKDSANAIGAIGFRFTGEKASAHEDGCTAHYGRPHLKDQSMYRTLNLAGFNTSKDSTINRPTTEITRLDVCYVPGTGRIAALVFYDNYGSQTTERLAWRQWGAAGHEPEGLTRVTQEPPKDDQQWKFVGLAGDFDHTVWGDVLARVSGIWRRV